MDIAHQQTDRFVLVAGSGGGIGAAFARNASAHGWGVVLGHRRLDERSTTLGSELRQAGRKVCSVALPLENGDAIDAAVDQLVVSGLPVTAIALCACPRPRLASFLKTTDEDLQHQFRINVVGYHRLIATVWKRFFRPNGSGHIIFVSTAALKPPIAPHMLSYVVAKSAMVTLLHSAVSEFGKAGLRVSIVSPGFTETAMLQAFPPQLLKTARLQTGGFLSPESVAQVMTECMEHPPQNGEIVVREVSSAKPR